MPNINITTKIPSTKETNSASSTKTGVSDVTSDANSFKELLSHQLDTSKSNQSDKSEKTTDKKLKDLKENIDQLSNADENSVTPNVAPTNINPIALSGSSSVQSSVEISTLNAEVDSQSKGKSILEFPINATDKKTLPLAAEPPIRFTTANENTSNEAETADFSNAVGKSFSAMTDKIKYSNPEIIDKIPRSIIGNIATTTETKDAFISSMTNNDPSNGTQFIQTQPIINQLPVTESIPKFSVHSKIGSYGWGDEIANKLTYMVSEKLQSAQLHINPEHLGPIEVKIQIDNDKQTTIHFSALHADTRQALENAIPQLKTMLTDNGVTLTNCSVNPNAFANSFNHQQQNQPERNPSTTSPEKENSVDNTIKSTQISVSGSVDLFV